MTDVAKIDGAVFTPEMAQALDEITPEAKDVSVEETPEEKPEEKEPVKENPEPEEAPELDLPKKRTIYDDYKEKKAEVKEAKDEAVIANARIQELEALLDAKNNAETPAEKKEVAKDIAEFAESIGADPDAIAQLETFFKSRQGNDNKDGISKEDVEFVKQFRATQAQTVANIEFEKEWTSLIPSIKAKFPTVSDAELADIRKEVDKVAHTQAFNDKELDYIFFKHEKTLSALVSPKRDSMEGGNRNAPDYVAKGEVELSGRSSPMDVENAMSQDRHESSLEIRSSN